MTKRKRRDNSVYGLLTGDDGVTTAIERDHREKTKKITTNGIANAPTAVEKMFNDDGR